MISLPVGQSVATLSADRLPLSALRCEETFPKTNVPEIIFSFVPRKGNQKSFDQG